MKKIKKHLQHITELIDFLKNEEKVYIQTHDFPDHDAVAGAYGLQTFLAHFGIKTDLVYDGEIQRDSLKTFIEDLKIEIHHVDKYAMSEKDKIIIVDGCKGNKNVTDLIGDEVGIIDHHVVSKPEDVEFSDIRQDYGSCASIIGGYFLEQKMEINKNLATAFMVAINMDTAQLTRGTHRMDLRIYFKCFGCADVEYVNRMIRNNIEYSDLKQYNYLTNNLDKHGRVAFCYFRNGCTQNLLGILGDFVISVKEIGFVLLIAENRESINFSIRNEEKKWSAAKIIKTLLKNRGFGGGHNDMAGGIIYEKEKFDYSVIKNEVLSLLSD